MDSLFSMSQTSIAQKLDKLISDFQQGKRRPSVISLQKVDSLDLDDQETWRTIRKELEDSDISAAAFDANKDFISEYFSKAVNTGAFQVQASNGVRAAVGPHAPAMPTKVPRTAAFLASLSRPKKRLKDALLASDLKGARKILKDPATSRLIDKQTLNEALDWAIQETLEEACALLIDAGADISDGRLYHQPLKMAVAKGGRDIVAFLLDRGADVNYKSGDGTSLLTTAVWNGNRDLAALLLDRGADVNYQSGDGIWYSSALRAAILQADEAMITLLSERGADLNAVQKCNEIKDLHSEFLGAARYQIPIQSFVAGDNEVQTLKENAEVFPANLNTAQSYIEKKEEHLRNLPGYPTGIHQASVRDRVAIVDLLIKLGADFNSPQRGFGTPLMFSIYSGCFSTAELLIKRGANIDEVNVPLSNQFRMFYSALYVAIYVSSPYLVSLLLYNGAGTNLHGAYEFAAERRKQQHWNERPELLFRWDKRQTSEILADAGLIERLIKEHDQRSAGHV